MSKARWRCRRGMRELDLVLEAFLREEFETLSETDKARFEELLDQPDPVILAWLRGECRSEGNPLAGLLGRIAGYRPGSSSTP